MSLTFPFQGELLVNVIILNKATMEHSSQNFQLFVIKLNVLKEIFYLTTALKETSFNLHFYSLFKLKVRYMGT